VSIDREFPAVRINGCLNAGRNIAGNPVHIPSFITAPNTPPIVAVGVVAYVQSVDWLFSATLRRTAGQETTFVNWGVMEYRFSFHKKPHNRISR
jgi:hypothetical protein